MEFVNLPKHFSGNLQSTRGFCLRFVNLPAVFSETRQSTKEFALKFVYLPEDVLWNSSIYPRIFFEIHQSTRGFSLKCVNLPENFLWNLLLYHTLLLLLHPLVATTFNAILTHDFFACLFFRLPWSPHPSRSFNSFCFSASFVATSVE